MTERSRAMATTMVGAAVGAVAAYMFFTPEGRALRRRIEPAIEDLTRELDGFRGTFARVSTAANQGWKFLQDSMGEARGAGAGHVGRYADARQTSPF